MKLFVVTDMHFLSPALTDNGAPFIRMLERGDGKLSEYSVRLAAALEKRVITERPDALVIAGDLTFNGERKSLEDLSVILGRVKDSGIPVLVIPGNHDIAYPQAYCYRGTKAYRVENLDSAAFRSVCGCFGYGDAAERDAESTSYYYPLGEDRAILFLDANTEKSPGAVLPGTLAWAEDVLVRAKSRGIRVISVTHQNVLAQNPLITKGFILENAAETERVLRLGGVRLNLSGHSHLHHTAVKDGLTDHCTGAFSAAPFRFTIVSAEPGEEERLHTGSLGILEREGRERVRASVLRQAERGLEGLVLTDGEREKLLDFAVRFNTAYFAGNADLSPMKEEPAWKLWREKGKGSFWLSYMGSVLSDK